MMVQEDLRTPRPGWDASQTAMAGIQEPNEHGEDCLPQVAIFQSPLLVVEVTAVYTTDMVRWAQAE